MEGTSEVVPISSDVMPIISSLGTSYEIHFHVVPGFWRFYHIDTK